MSSLSEIANSTKSQPMAIQDGARSGLDANGNTASEKQAESNSTSPSDPYHQPTSTASDGIFNGQVPIAICGMACRLPGGVMTPDELWDFVLAKKDGRCRVPASRYNIDAYYSNTKKPGTVSTQHGYFLDESVNLGALDMSFFTMSRSEVERADPQQRLLLEVAREALEDAGVIDWRGRTIGTYIGNFGEDWLEMMAKENQAWGIHRVAGSGDFTLANRLSYEFDLQGPSMTIRTACSSALVALNEACAAIQRGDCESALVGGVNLILAPGMTTAMEEQGVLASDGSCKTFSADANGYARGEAVTTIFIKPLADAIRDGNPVQAVIRSTSHNVDGKTPTPSHPSTDMQETLMRRAYALAGIRDFSETAMVECHGTGTAIGDLVETKAVARVFGEKGVYIGSIKPNVGHTEAASGLVSLLKAVKALEHHVIPPNIKFTTPNPEIPFEEAKLVVPTEAIPWPKGRLERISVNAFGIGGANAHVIVESAATYNAPTASNDDIETPHLLLFSANSSKSITRMIENYKAWLEHHPEKAAGLAYTLARKRTQLPYRAFGIANKGVLESVSQPIHSVASSTSLNVVMVFTGQGAHWPQMGRELLELNVTFMSSIRRLDKHLSGLIGEQSHQYSIEQELKKAGKKSRLSSAEFSQPLCTAIQIALVDTLRAAGIVPHAVVGHSSGEIAAAYAAGALTAEEAITAAHYRGAATTKQEKPGTMAAIGMGWEETGKYLVVVPGVAIACDNSPQSVTISGDVDAVKSVVAAIKKDRPQILARLLQVDKAYHSHHMKEIGEHYHSLIGGQVGVGRASSALFFSSVTGNLADPEHDFGPKYWQSNLELPVRFREAVTNISKHQVGKNAVFLEIGPHGALAGPLRQIFSHLQASAVGTASSTPYVSAMVRNQDCAVSLLAAIGSLHSLNAAVDLEALFPSGTCLPNLPRYPFNHEHSYWYESRSSKEWRSRRFPYHDLLGVRVVESSESEPSWRNLLHVANAPWLRDHRIGDDIVFPFCGYIALAGEAIRQLTDLDEGFAIRNIIVSTALVLSEGTPTEIIAAFRPHRLTDALDSSWWDFTVSAYNGRNWTKHCTGQVTAQSCPPEDTRDPDALRPLPRKLNVSRWFEKMAGTGLQLGPSFQTLNTISTSTSEQRAMGYVVNGRQGDEAHYFIHPTVLDSTLQILGAAAINGHARKTKTWLPTGIDHIKVYRCTSDMNVSVSAKLSSNHSVVGHGSCTAEGKIVVDAVGIRMSAADVDGAGSVQVAGGHAASRCEWKPAIEFLDVKSLFRAPASRACDSRALGELGELCLRWSQWNFLQNQSQTDLPAHLQRYVAWIKSQSTEPTSMHSSFSSSETGFETQAFAARIDSLLNQLADTPAGPVAAAIHQVCTNMNTLLSGTGMEDVLPEGTMTRVYEYLGYAERKEFLQALIHSKPSLRILEIGNSKGVSLHREILDELTRPDGEILCAKYTLTTPGYFVVESQEKLFPNMDFATLDLNQDPFEQGFDETGYDLIIAVNALHETKNVEESLAHVKKLLRRDGRLLLQELSPSSRWVDYLLGLLPSWFSSGEGGPAKPPYLSQEYLESMLAATGFGTPECVVFDAERPHHVTTTIIARYPCEMAVKKVAVLVESEGPVVASILSRLEDSGYEISRCRLENAPPAGLDVLSLLDIEDAFFHDITEERFLAFKKFVLGLQMNGCGMLWATHLVDMGCLDPRYAQVIGLARTLRTEQTADAMATCQVDDFNNSQSIDCLLQVLAKFQARQDDEELDPDVEWAIVDSVVQVPRFHPFVLSDELLVPEGPGEMATLNVGTVGRINSLHFARHERQEPEEDEVEVQVYSTGLNFRDILVALGIVELPVRLFGIEAAGIVTRVGAGVSPDCLQPGDRVFCGCRKDGFSTYVTTLAALCVRIPDSLAFDQAGTMLVPYMTAIYSLINMGRVGKGQTVLIHSACGGVGLAAIQIAQMLEAEVYATVGNEEKAKYLVENCNIPRNRIFNSRDSSFVEGVMRETHGRGMDFVLNSLSGELLHASWACVAEFGYLLEIGKRDLIGGGKLDMRPFLANRNYCCVDIDGLWERTRVHVARALLFSILDFYGKGFISPLPRKIFPAHQTQDAFRFMEKGQHIGRVGVTIKTAGEDEAETTFQSTSKVLKVAFSPSASYLMVGGLGGIGRAVSTWMVEHGAREIIFMSRSAGLTNEHEDFIKELESMGCAVKLHRGDVTKLEDVERAIYIASHPVKGIVQMTMVLADENFTQMSYQKWMAATAPKVQGTWNLHNASMAARLDLDFMVMFSSISGIVGQAGQANYASANSFLDAFAQYRNGLGLAASVVDMGAVEDIGWLSEHQEMIGVLSRAGMKPLLEQEVIDAMAVSMLVHNKPPENATPTAQLAASSTMNEAFGFSHKNTFVVGLALLVPLHDPSNYVIWKKDRRMASYHNNSTVAAAASSTDALKTYLNHAKADPSILKSPDAAHFFAVEIGKKLLHLLLKPDTEDALLKTSMPLTDLGLDSLVALELRAWMKQVFSFDLPILKMMSIGSLDVLGQYTANEMYMMAMEKSRS
ncbi:Type I Iterative PKS [Claviceps purpurea]|nr:Type I Iterative PKS [Claviceps purpurea]